MVSMAFEEQAALSHGTRSIETLNGASVRAHDLEALRDPQSTIREWYVTLHRSERKERRNRYVRASGARRTVVLLQSFPQILRRYAN
jgi:hypothetical protein